MQIDQTEYRKLYVQLNCIILRTTDNIILYILRIMPSQPRNKKNNAHFKN